MVRQTTTEGRDIMSSLSLRISDADEQRLDRLVIAVRAFYEAAPSPFNRLATETCRSSVLRDLLLAWDRGENASEMFSRELTGAIT